MFTEKVKYKLKIVNEVIERMLFAKKQQKHSKLFKENKRALQEIQKFN